jgi:hypothetical protein
VELCRLRTLPDGRSTLDSVDLDLRPVPGKPYDDTGRIEAGPMFVRSFRRRLVSEWHPPSRRQLIVVLSGGVRVETGSGHSRHLEAGELLFADDTGGEGHRTVSLEGSRLYIGIPDTIDLFANWSTPNR